MGINANFPSTNRVMQEQFNREVAAQLLALSAAPTTSVSGDSLLDAAAVHGVTGDGATDDTAAVQAAITAGMGTGSEFSGVRLPPGQIVLTDTLTIPLSQGWRLQGAGCPTEMNPTHAAKSRGTVFIWKGPSGKPMINLDGCYGHSLKDFALMGTHLDGSGTRAAIGIRQQNRPGFGSAQSLVENVMAVNCEVGFDSGSIDAGDVTHNADGGDTITFIRFVTHGCGRSFRCNQVQNLAFVFIGCGATVATSFAHLVKGGNLSIFGLSLYDVFNIIECDEQGTNIGYTTVDNARSDGTAFQTRALLMNSGASDGRFSFRDVVFNAGQPNDGTSRLIVRGASTVRVDGGGNWQADGGGSIFDAYGPCDIAAHGVELANPATVAGVVSGSVTYRFRNNIDAVTHLRIDDFDEAGVIPR